MMNPTISFAIPTYRRPGYLRQALESIAADSGDEAGRLEIIVSSNGPDDEAERVARSFDGLAVSYHANERNLGPVENILLACERCSGEFVFLLFDDDLLAPERPDLGVLASPTEVFSDPPSPGRTNRERFAMAGAGDRLLREGSEAFESLFLRATHGSGVVIRRDLLDFEGARKHAESLYPQIYLVGQAAKQADGHYFAQPLVEVRANPVVHWQYSHDYMAAAVLHMLDDLTANEPWGRPIRRRLIRRRVLATFGPLFEARRASLGAFARAARGLASVSAYRTSPVFWGMVLGIGLLGIRGTRLLRRLLPITGADVVT